MEIEDVRKIRKGREEKGEMVIVSMKTEENKRKIIENKRKLKEKEIWIEEDRTFKERKMQWKLRKVEEEEKRRKDKMVKLWENLDRWYMVVLG